MDTAALDTVLASLEVHPAAVRRRALPAGGLLALVPGVVTVAYLTSGRVDADVAEAVACRVVAGSCTVDARPTPGRRSLSAGDAFLSTGGRPVVLESVGGAELVTADVDLRWPATARGLPPFAHVTGFADLEPAAAALAGRLGPSPQPVTTPTSAAVPGVGADGTDGTDGADSADLPRPGDPVICRLMVTTVVLSVVRAWAHAGCAPTGWPLAPEDGDPFLARVAAAVRADPARSWTVGLLAGHAAMSRTVFAERFRSTFGLSPASFVTEVRMQRAMELLETGAAVSAASRALGYGSDEGFSRAFRRHTGHLPSQWRGRQREVGAAATAGSARPAPFARPNSTAPTSSATAASR